MNEPTPETPRPIGLADLDDFTRAYLRCALWASTDNDYHGEGDPRNLPDGKSNGGSPLDDNYDLEDIAPACLAQAKADCEGFRDYCRKTGVDIDSVDGEQAGHDFFLTRNGHGTGFWDRGLGKLGDDLSKASKTFGSVDFYIGADGKVYSQ